MESQKSTFAIFRFLLGTLRFPCIGDQQRAYVDAKIAEVGAEDVAATGAADLLVTAR
jgi:hypothetical protein